MNRLEEIRLSKGLKGPEAAEGIGINYNRYRSYEKEERQMNSEVLIQIADFYGVSIDYILCRDNASKLKPPLVQKYEKLDDFGKRAVNAVLDAELERCDKVVDLGTIRKYLSRPAAGVNGLVEGEDYEDIPRTVKTPPDADFALVVSGDSMEPYIKDGETVYVKRDEPLQPMDVGVFGVDGATYIKQYAPMYDGSLMLLSANPKREDSNIRISKDSGQSVHYFGKVLLKKKLPQPNYK